MMIKTFFKQNSIGILFVIVALIFGVAIYFSFNQQSQNGQELTRFARDEISYIRSTNSEIIKKSNDLPLEEKSFDTLVNDFKSMSTKLENDSKKIPTGSNNETSETVKKELSDLMLEVRTTIISAQIEKLKGQKDLVNDYVSFSNLQKNVTSGKRSDIESSIKSGITIRDFRNSYLKVIDPDKVFDLVSPESDSLSQTKGILNRSNDLLNDDQKKEITTIWDNKWPANPAILPIIDKSELEPFLINSHILTLEDTLTKLEKTK